MMALVIAAASYGYVEAPFRKHRGRETWPKTRPRLFVASAGAITLMGCTAMAATMNNGWMRRVSPKVLAYDQARSPFILFKDDCDGQHPDERNPRCVIGDRSSSRLALVWGDSYALAWLPGLDSLLKERGLRGVWP